MKFDIFSSENLLMSVGGHLLLAAMLVTSIVIVFDRATMVAPDRIQIVEIDLNSVKVSGTETSLYNTDAPTEPDAPTPKEESAPAPTPQPEPEADPTPIEAPSMVEDSVEKEPEKESEPVPEPEQPVEKIPAPKKKTIVRVNREKVGLDRTLTVSVLDALRVAMTRCWVIDTRRPDIENIRAVAHLTLRQNGTVRDVWFESAARAETDPAFAYVLDTIRAAIQTCQPFSMLPVDEFKEWEKIQLTFYPTQGKVM